MSGVVDIYHPVSWSISFISVIFLIVGLMFNNKTLGIVLSIIATTLLIVVPYYSANTIFEASKSKSNKIDHGLRGAINVSISFSSLIVFLLLAMIFIKYYYDVS